MRYQGEIHPQDSSANWISFVPGGGTKRCWLVAFFGNQERLFGQ